MVVKDISNEAVIKNVHASVTAMASRFNLHPE
jgi:hypothetical protein